MTKKNHTLGSTAFEKPIAGADVQKKVGKVALAYVAQWIEHWPAKQKVTSLIPSQGTCLSCKPSPWLGTCAREQIEVSLTYQCFSLSLFPSLPLSLKIN